MKKTPKAPAQPAAALKWSGCTDCGRVRKNNEDAFLGLRFDAQEMHRLGKVGAAEREHFQFAFAVCDGMGGALAGEYASQIAVDKITKLLPQAFQPGAAGDSHRLGQPLQELFREVHRALVYLGASYEECAGMQTTMSLCWFTPERMYFGHVGDSRIYHLPAGQTVIRQLTDDDTHVGWLLRQGQINEREARTHPRRNVLQKALGGENQFVDPQTGSVACKPGDQFLLCSDGLCEGLYDHLLVDLLRTAAGPHITPAEALVRASVNNDGRDNTTALVIEVV